MKRIVMHWSVGGYTPNGTDLEHYHEIVDGAGKVHVGVEKISDNENTADGDYAAHTRGLNKGSIGIALSAMAGAQERPFKWGRAPIKPVQIDAMTTEVARLCKVYKIPVTRQTVLTHAEVEITLGVDQLGKWDITVLPGMDKPGDPVAVGDKLRALVAAKLKAL